MDLANAVGRHMALSSQQLVGAEDEESPPSHVISDLICVSILAPGRGVNLRVILPQELVDEEVEMLVSGLLQTATDLGRKKNSIEAACLKSRFVHDTMFVDPVEKEVMLLRQRVIRLTTELQCAKRQKATASTQLDELRSGYLKELTALRSQLNLASAERDLSKLTTKQHDDVVWLVGNGPKTDSADDRVFAVLRQLAEEYERNLTLLSTKSKRDPVVASKLFDSICNFVPHDVMHSFLTTPGSIGTELVHKIVEQNLQKMKDAVVQRLKAAVARLRWRAAVQYARAHALQRLLKRARKDFFMYRWRQEKDEDKGRTQRDAGAQTELAGLSGPAAEGEHVVRQLAMLLQERTALLTGSRQSKSGRPKPKPSTGVQTVGPAVEKPDRAREKALEEELAQAKERLHAVERQVAVLQMAPKPPPPPPPPPPKPKVVSVGVDPVDFDTESEEEEASPEHKDAFVRARTATIAGDALRIPTALSSSASESSTPMAVTPRGHPPRQSERRTRPPPSPTRGAREVAKVFGQVRREREPVAKPKRFSSPTRRLPSAAQGIPNVTVVGSPLGFDLMPFQSVPHQRQRLHRPSSAPMRRTGSYTR
mmetsp:Transcript_49138/g.111250  ORF Transcript_49138/g.111250 Transcript_49138/m.111250 type:complete len:595 (-) Transcript_49138:1702-3486(-)